VSSLRASARPLAPGRSPTWSRRIRVSMRGVARSVAMTIVVGAVLSGGAGPTVAAQEERFCVTVRSDEPIEGDWLAAVISGDATIVVEDAAVCTAPARTGDVREDAMVDTATDLLASLQIAPETSGGYDRDQFRHWVDADGDGLRYPRRGPPSRLRISLTRRPDHLIGVEAQGQGRTAISGANLRRATVGSPDAHDGCVVWVCGDLVHGLALTGHPAPGGLSRAAVQCRRVP
jgi:hypothetical protein